MTMRCTHPCKQARKQMEVEATEKNKIILQLESEKKKIEEDVQNLRLETERRKLARSGINQVSMSESVTQKASACC